ncbi:MAG: hypothetical protein NC242_00805 [Roseburia sp.]|nr:hypothetical protein [Roseburia sp.]MCM1431017.1 hypothetical protein [Muribaculaceae bacterium]
MNGKIKSVCLVLILLLNGCGAVQEEQPPRLLEPVTGSAYRPVERKDIGDTEVLFAVAVPKDYCHYFEAPATLQEICVGVGEIVEKGDVLACGNAEAAKEELSSLGEQLAWENESFRIREAQAKLRIRQMKTADGGDGAEMLSRQEEENLRYDRSLHGYRVEKIKAGMEAQKQLLEDSVLKAEHGGLVTYVKSLGDSLTAAGNENIVVVSDMEKLHLECDMAVDEYEYRDYARKYMLFDGRQVSVAEMDYSSGELVLAEIFGKYPRLAFSCPGGQTLTPGESYPIYFVREDVQNVPVVAKDSLYSDADGTYVYVKNEAGERERRNITTGASDSSYTEVVSGLVEGEWVFYESREAIPENYSEYKVERKDFELENHALSYEAVSAMAFPVISRCGGTITELSAEEGQSVKPKDPLYVLDTGVGRAAVAEAQAAIDRENRAYKKQVKEYDRQEAELSEDSGFEKKMLALDRKLAKLTHEENLRRLADTYDQLQAEGGGSGKCTVYAGVGGTVTALRKKEGDVLTEGELVMEIATGEGRLVRLTLIPAGDASVPVEESMAGVGQTVTLAKSGENISGVCVGQLAGSAAGQRVYAFTDKSGAHLTYNAESKQVYNGFYVQLEEAADYNGLPSGSSFTFPYLAMHVVTVPSQLVKTQTDALSGEKQTYVWRLVDGVPVKQYVLADEELSGTKTVILSGLSESDVLAVE